MSIILLKYVAAHDKNIRQQKLTTNKMQVQMTHHISMNDRIRLGQTKNIG